MKSLFEHIDTVKEKPHHVRRKVAFSAALGGTAVIALAWFIFTLSAGTFALQGSTFADSTQPAVVASGNSANKNLAGAASALPAASQPAHITIVDSKVATTS